MMGEIGVIGPSSEDDFAANVADGLLSMDFTPHCLGPANPQWLSGRALALARVARRDPRVSSLMERPVLSSIQQRGIKLVITVVALDPRTVETLARQGVQVVLWFPDAVSNLGTLRMFDAPYTGLFFKEPWLVRHLNSLIRLPVHYLPEACNPRIHRPVEGGGSSGKVVVVGNLHPIRARLLERLVDDGVPIEIFGDPRHAQRYESLAPYHSGRYVRGVDKAAVFRSAAAVLNNLHPAEIEGVNCRLFEATACGGAVVTEYREALPRLFEPGAEVYAFDNYDQLLLQLRTLVMDPTSALELRAAASHRALQDHTYAQRLRSMLELLV
jgi:spore maturation protein CgeB